MDASQYLEIAEIAERFVAHPRMAERWDGPSALEGYTIGGLAAHLSRAVLTVARYLDGGEPVPDAEQVDAAGYLAAVLADHDPVDSEFHAQVRSRGEDAASAGPAEVVRAMREARVELVARLPEVEAEQLVAVLDGTVIPVGEYLRTRLVELIVHLDDLAVSLGDDGPPELPEAAYDSVAAVLAQVAARRVGGLATIRSLARRERHPQAVRAL